MKCTAILLCLGLLVVTGPLLACAQSIAAGVATADADGPGDVFSGTEVGVAAGPDIALSYSSSIADNSDQWALGDAGSVAEGEYALAITATDATTDGSDTQSSSTSISANDPSNGDPVVAVGDAQASAETDDFAFVATSTGAVTDPNFSASGASSVALSDQPGDNGVDYVDAYGYADSIATGDGAQTEATTTTDVGPDGSSSSSSGVATSGRKLRFN